MSAIQQETAARIWQCYREIQTAEKLLNDMKENDHRLFDVSLHLTKSVIKSHIASRKTKLVEANEQTRIELGG